MDYERSITLAHDIEAVFAFIADETKLVRWREGLRESRRLTPGDDLDGARYAETIETPLGVRTLTVELEARPPYELTFRVVDGPIRPNGKLALRTIAAGTELTYRIDYTPMLRVATPLDRVVFASLTAAVDKSLAKLADIIGS
jgi:hypothetical protein